MIPAHHSTYISESAAPFPSKSHQVISRCPWGSHFNRSPASQGSSAGDRLVHCSKLRTPLEEGCSCGRCQALLGSHRGRSGGAVPPGGSQCRRTSRGQSRAPSRAALGSIYTAVDCLVLNLASCSVSLHLLGMASDSPCRPSPSLIHGLAHRHHLCLGTSGRI